MVDDPKSGTPQSGPQPDATPVAPPSNGDAKPPAEPTTPIVVSDEDPVDVSMFEPPLPGATPAGEEPLSIPRLVARRRTRRLVKPTGKPGAAAAKLTARAVLNGKERLLLLDLWRRSALPASDFAALVGVGAHTLYEWRRRFEQGGPAALMDAPRAKKGSHLPEYVQRAILMLKEDNPELGCQKISDMLARAEGLTASPGAVSHVLHEHGYEFEEVPTRPHGEEPMRFERAKPNQLWQTDLFTFMLKRQNRRVYFVAFMDDHSRFIVSYGLHATANAAFTIEVLRAGVVSYQAPEEVLTDNGPQYITWRGTSAFTHECIARGIRHIVAKPRRPRTLGKIERFWATLWVECVERAIFLDLEDARRRIGLFIDHYNFQRPHQGLGNGLVPADRFFGAAPEVLKTLRARVAANAQSIAVNGFPKNQLYLTGKVGQTPVSVHTEGERVILTPQSGVRQEIDLVPPRETPPDVVCPHGAPAGDEGNEPPAAPGTSPIDEVQP